MQKVFKQLPKTFNVFDWQKQILLEQEKLKESSWMRFIVTFIPDFTRVLELPLLKNHPYIQFFLINREGVTLILLISSIVLIKFAEVATMCTGGLIKIAFIAIKLTSEGAIIVLITSIFKRYHHLRRNFTQTQIVSQMVKGMFSALQVQQGQILTRKKQITREEQHLKTQEDHLKTQQDQIATREQQIEKQERLLVELLATKGELAGSAKDMIHLKAEINTILDRHRKQLEAHNAKLEANIHKLGAVNRNLGKEIDRLKFLKEKIQAASAQLRTDTHLLDVAVARATKKLGDSSATTSEKRAQKQSMSSTVESVTG